MHALASSLSATKLTIGNVPMSFSNKEILIAIQSPGIKTRSNLLEERDRDPSAKLTRWKTGRREKVPVYRGTCKTSPQNSAQRYIYRQHIPQGADARTH